MGLCKCSFFVVFFTGVLFDPSVGFFFPTPHPHPPPVSIATRAWRRKGAFLHSPRTIVVDLVLVEWRRRGLRRIAHVRSVFRSMINNRLTIDFSQLDDGIDWSNAIPPHALPPPPPPMADSERVNAHNPTFIFNWPLPESHPALDRHTRPLPRRGLPQASTRRGTPGAPPRRRPIREP